MLKVIKETDVKKIRGIKVRQLSVHMNMENLHKSIRSEDSRKSIPIDPLEKSVSAMQRAGIKSIKFARSRTIVEKKPYVV
jgi:hypothetical protein